MLIQFIRRKKKFNRLTKSLFKKKRISSTEAGTWWSQSTKNRIQAELNNDLSFMIDLNCLDKKAPPEFFKWAKPVITRPKFLFRFQNTVIHPKESQIYFIDLDKCTSDLGAKFDCEHSIFDFFSRKILLDSEIINGNILHLGISSPSNNFWHWMHEVYARLIRAKRFYDLNFFDKIIIPKITHSFQLDALKLLGIEKDSLITNESFFKCKGNLFTLNIDSITSSLELREFFMNSFSNEISLIDRKVFLDRNSKSGNQIREIINFESHKSKYLEAGFEFIRPETLSIKEQAKLFLTSKSVIGASGSAFTLASLMPINSKVVEIFSKNFVDPAIAMNCAAAKIKYGFYVENAFRPSSKDSWNRNANMKIDANLVDHKSIIDFLSS